MKINQPKSNPAHCPIEDGDMRVEMVGPDGRPVVGHIEGRRQSETEKSTFAKLSEWVKSRGGRHWKQM